MVLAPRPINTVYWADCNWCQSDEDNLNIDPNIIHMNDIYCHIAVIFRNIFDRSMPMMFYSDVLSDVNK